MQSNNSGLLIPKMSMFFLLLYVCVCVCVCVCVKPLQWCPALCELMDCSPSGSSVHEIPQARILGMVCHALLQGHTPPFLCLLYWQAGSLPLAPPGRLPSFISADNIVKSSQWILENPFYFCTKNNIRWMIQKCKKFWTQRIKYKI